MKLFGSMQVEKNQLYIGGISLEKLAKEYGTPLYVVDEKLVRQKCKEYYENFKVNENGNRVAYAGKAFLPIAMCQIVKEEGLSLDVVSGGELYTAYKAGFDMDNVLFHGNNKTLDEMEMGVRLNVGRFVADNFYEIENLNKIAKKMHKIQKVFLRITPGIEAHTHEYIKTGQIDSKFGFTLINGDAIKAVKEVLKFDNIELAGLHCHIGSQIFDIEPYLEETKVMFKFIKQIKEETGYEIKELDLGGGFGIYYTEKDKPKTAKQFCTAILNEAGNLVKEFNIKTPKLIIEPGRSIIGNAGSTLYTVGSIKEIPGIRKYVSVDGGMSDNIRSALYNAEYECEIINKFNDSKEKVAVAGKCCESGDILINDICISEVKSGDVLVVATTGAYGYSMANNYNKIPKPAVVLVGDGKEKLICKRESYEDMLSREL
ncbi:diaminopimelate decarboxylase [Clostridium felsineum]|uniref:diaminopimelate decarboxylase n=1 Tax=Clostridium felsineum TaxID=36839 RepID=UPI00098C09CE|nr:diaminopimelate decarboxylase [Clostridium felsineum]URZ17705.1 Diaminopimelate decarboxylase [Clostridium felsineum DSM 794]